MYPDIPPRLKLEETISHPIRTEEVIGFKGRNTLLGRESIVMNEGAVSDGIVSVPTEVAEGIEELVVLDGETVHAMNGDEFLPESHPVGVEGRGKSAVMSEVVLDSDHFRSFPENVVEVGN